MSKITVFELTKTLKAGNDVFLKGSRFTEDTLPALLKDELDSGSQTIEVFSYGEDFEGSTFEPEETVTIKEPKKRLKSKLIKKK